MLVSLQQHSAMVLYQAHMTVTLPMQVVVVTDAALANVVLGRRLGLDKAVEPTLSDELLSMSGHHTMFSAG